MICIWHSLVPLRKREKKLWIELESITRLTSIVVMKTSIQRMHFKFLEKVVDI
jgi:hypothetical protein